MSVSMGADDMGWLWLAVAPEMAVEVGNMANAPGGPAIDDTSGRKTSSVCICSPWRAPPPYSLSGASAMVLRSSGGWFSQSPGKVCTSSGGRPDVAIGC